MGVSCDTVGAMPPTKPRIPGSQVAPNERPQQHINRRTATTHSRVPLAQATAGRTYRVRDKGWVVVWGTGLTWDEATKLKNQVVGAKKSRTARIEDEEITPPDWYVPPTADAGEPMSITPHPVTPVTVESQYTYSVRPEGAEFIGMVAEFPDLTWVGSTQEEAIDGIKMLTVDHLHERAKAGQDAPAQARGARFEIANDKEVIVPVFGVIHKIPDGHELVVNGFAQPVPVSVQVGDKVQARPVDPLIVAARAAANAAVRHTLQQRKIYRDVTATPANKPNLNPPKDPTVSKDGVYIRLGAPAQPVTKPPPSPLKVATMQDGEALGDDALTDDDLPDLASDIGGGASDADLEHAKKVREQDEAAKRTQG
jgi:hypothetical protein